VNEGRATKNEIHRTLLEMSVRKHLVPVFAKLGFTTAPLVVRDSPTDRELVQSFPAWARLARVREQVVDLVEIQFSTHGRAAFRLNAGVVQRNGLMTLSGHRPATEVCVHWLSEYVETHARPWLRPTLRALGWESLGAWFSVWQWHKSPTQGDCDELALRVAGFVPELELALREGRLGPHIRRVVIPRRPPKLPEEASSSR
jgi:hypothetical protein